MARSIEEIRDSILTEKTNHPELVAMNSSSVTALWRLIVYVVAVVIWIHEKLWDVHKAEVEGIAARAVPGTTRWFQYITLQYQTGYTLEWNPDLLQYEYSQIDEVAMIVQRAAVREIGGTVRVKVAKLNGLIPEPLSAPEKLGVESYLSKVKPAGTFVDVVSLDPDYLRLQLKVYYDPNVQATVVQAAVEKAVNAYIENLPFDGDLRLTHLIDAVQLVEGVEDPIVTNSEARYGALPFFQFDESYIPQAGYMAIDPAFPLSATIGYLPKLT